MVKEKKVDYVFSVGKRRLAIARAKIKLGRGNIIINSKPLDFWGTELLRLMIKEPLILANMQNKIDAKINVRSGGIVGQAEAIRQALAKGILKLVKDQNLKKTFLEYDRNLIIYDPRRNEPHHSSGRGASKRGSRRHKQRSKR